MTRTIFKTKYITAMALLTIAVIIGTMAVFTPHQLAEAASPVVQRLDNIVIPKLDEILAGLDALGVHLLDPSAHHSATSTSYYSVFGPAGTLATSGQISKADADCNLGDKVVAGGFGASSGNIKDFQMFTSNALDSDTWRVHALHLGVTGTPGTPMEARAVARCLDLTP